MAFMYKVVQTINMFSKKSVFIILQQQALEQALDRAEVSNNYLLEHSIF